MAELSERAVINNYNFYLSNWREGQQQDGGGIWTWPGKIMGDSQEIRKILKVEGIQEVP